MLIDTILEALYGLFSIQHMMFMFFGVFMGILVGILPGLGGIVGFSILLPFLYGMDTTSALAMLIGMVAVIPTSDTFTSVLMGIPGSSASQATVLDGYPLSKKGEAARALGAAFSSSLVGGLIGALILTGFIIFARDLILMLTSAELFILGIFGLSMVGVLSGNSLFKGFLACGVGLLLGSIGGAPATGEWRMTFGSYYLFDGIKLVILGLGIYAVPEIIDLLVKNRSIAKTSALGKGWLRGVKDVWVYKWIVARCAPIGAMIGAIPGLGGSVVDWIAYGHVVQTAKDKSQFGKGDVRGVIAPESANNAKEGGGLVPTLLFGIPGSGSMAVFLGGLTILGVEPGPSLVGDNLNITYTIIWSLALANVVGTLTCLFLSPQVAKITTIPYGYVAPFMLMIIFFAALQATRSLEDLILLIAIGIIGTLFKYFDWSRPALLIGFVLAGTVETYYYQAVQFYSWEMLQRPGVLILGGLMIVSVLVSTIFKKRGDKVEDEDEGSAKSTYTFFSGELFFLIAVMLFGAYALVDSLKHNFLGGIFPIVVSSSMLLFGTILAFQITSKKKQSQILSTTIMENGEISGYWKAIWKNFLILPLFLLGVWLIGFLPALAILFVSIIRIKMAAPWWKIAIITCIAIGFLYSVSQIMVLHLPPGLVFDMFLGEG